MSSDVGMGIQVGAPEWGIDVRLPMFITQCEHFIIFYNITPTAEGVAAQIQYPQEGSIAFIPPDFAGTFFELFPLNGTGYIDWVCNIPAGDSLIIMDFGGQMYTVQPGSSACMDVVPVTTYFPDAIYYTDQYSLYTKSATNYPSGSYYSSLFSVCVILPNLCACGAQ